MTDVTTTLTLAAFLSARLDDDEAAARAATPGPWQVVPSYGRAGLERAAQPGTTQRGPVPADPLTWSDDGDVLLVEDATHIARHDPARVLADVGAKREIIRELDRARQAFEDATTPEGALLRTGAIVAGERAVTLLALPYRDHPDWREEWAL